MLLSFFLVGERSMTLNSKQFDAKTLVPNNPIIFQTPNRPCRTSDAKSATLKCTKALEVMMIFLSVVTKYGEDGSDGRTHYSVGIDITREAY